MDTLHAYELITKRQINEDRVVAERLTVGLLINSVALIAFFTAVNTPYFYYWIRFVLPAFGIVFSLGLGFVMFVSAKAMIRWYESLCKLEQKQDFDYLKDEGIRPMTDLSGMTIEGKRHMWKLGYYISPFFALPLVLLWILCLILN